MIKTPSCYPRWQQYNMCLAKHFYHCKKNQSSRPNQTDNSKRLAKRLAKQSTVGLCRRLDADLGAASGPSSMTASPCHARPAPLRSPASTVRKSSRVPNSGERVADWAAWRAAARDLPPSGTLPFSPPPPPPVSFC